MAADLIAPFNIDLIKPVANIATVQSPRSTVVGLVTIPFSERITGVDLADFTLTLNGVLVPLTGVPFGRRVDSSTFFEMDLTSVTKLAGSYVLTLSATTSGIIDQAGNGLASNATISWVTDLIAPTVSMTQATVSPRNTAVGVITLDFSKPVTGLDLSDFTLVRNGSTVSPLRLTLTTVSTTRYTLNLSTVTATPGDYVFIFNAAPSGIIDAAANRLAVGAQR